MTHLIRFDAAVAGYRPGDVVDLDLLEGARDPRIDAALDAGYAVRTTKAEAGDADVLAEPEVAGPPVLATTPEADAPPPTPAKKAGGRQRAS